MKKAVLLLVLISMTYAQTGETPVLSGPMLGHADLTEVVIWLQTRSAARVHLTYKTGDLAELRSDTVETRKDNWFIARFTLFDLVDSAEYSYQVFVDDQPISFPYPLHFRTQDFWQYRHDAPSVRFMMGSCFFLNEERHDRPGKGYGGEFEIFDVMNQQKADFMLWLGDNLYLREPDFGSINMMARRYSLGRAYEKIQPLLAAMPQYAIWDDHDFGPDNSNRSYPLKAQALELFKAFWANPSYGLPETPGTFGLLQWSDLDFFFLDDRYYRAPNQLDDPERPFLGEAQVQWLKDSLINSRASFKILVVGNQMINLSNQNEGYNKYEKEWQDLMNWLNKQPLSGLVIFSGDRHFTEMLKLEREGNYPLYEFTSSPITSGVSYNLNDIEKENPQRVPGTLVNDYRNFGLVEVTGPRDDRVMTLKTIDSRGKLRWTVTLNRNDLKFSGKKK